MSGRTKSRKISKRKTPKRKMVYVSIAVRWNISNKRWTCIDDELQSLGYLNHGVYDGYQRGGMTKDDPHMWYFEVPTKHLKMFVKHMTSVKDVQCATYSEKNAEISICLQ